MLTDVIKAALEQIQTIAKTETVIGEPIVAGPVTLIPVSRISIGFAAGGGGKDEKSNSGAGTGGGITITPIAFISIIKDHVQVHGVEKNDVNFAKILAMAPDLISKISGFINKNKEHKDK
ncbi:MAG: spore germination protein GerW family protein [Chitinivibrionales bacterium]|nr:spore germination protein GerW family protein [Chitinivibrionales bacterium]